MSLQVTPSLDSRLDALFAGDPAALGDPFTLYGEVREQAPAYVLGPTVILTRYDDVRTALRDRDRLSSRAFNAGSRFEAARARLAGDERDAFDEVYAFGSNFLNRTDGEHHARLRRIVHRAFTPRRIAELEAATVRYVDELLDTWSGAGAVDATGLAYRLPLMVVGDLLGVPRSDLDTIHDWSVSLGAASASMEGPVLVEAREAVRAFRGYVAAMLGSHRGAGGTDLMDVLLDAEQDERADDDELAAIFVQLLFAGHETTSSLIGIGLAELLAAPEAWLELTGDLALVPEAVEEQLRLVTPTQFGNRVAVDDLELAGLHIEAGTTVLPVIAAANRDPEIFAAPNTFSLARREAQPQLAFGFGAHFCLGAALARLEGQVALRALARRFPGLAPAGSDPEWGGGAMLRRLRSFTVVPGPDRGRLT